MQTEPCFNCYAIKLVNKKCERCASAKHIMRIMNGGPAGGPIAYVGISGRTKDILAATYVAVVFNSGDLDLWALDGIDSIEELFRSFQEQGETWVKKSDIRVFKNVLK